MYVQKIISNIHLLFLQSVDPLLLANNVAANNNNVHASTKSQLRVELRDPSIHGAGSLIAGQDQVKTFRCCSVECNCFVAYLLMGMIGFVVFWSALMLRIYLPEKYWTWSYIWS